MSRLRAFTSKLLALLSGGRADREFDQEIEDHLAMLAERYVRAGRTPEEARDEAVRQFGSVTSLRESRRETSGFATLQALNQDLRQGARLLGRDPGWTAVAVLTLAVGIGANAAIFGLIRPILLEPLPYPEADRLVVPCTVFSRSNADRGAVSHADIFDWKGMTDLFDSVSALNPTTVDVTDGETPERLPAVIADDTYFRVLGSSPLLGRFFTAEENLPGAPPVAVLSHALWQRRFGGDRRVVGRRIELRGIPTTIIGVTRADAVWPREAEIVQPLGTGGTPTADMLRRDNHVYQAVARLRHGVSLERAQAALAPLADQIARREANRAATSWKLHALLDYLVGSSLRMTLTLLFGAAIVVLLIVSVNVANLQLARGLGREREVAVRAALGAGRRRIAAQFLVESALLATAGGLGGLLVGWWGLAALVRFAPPGIPRIEQAKIDVPVFLFSLALCLAVTVLAGLAPAWQAARVSPGRSLQSAGRLVGDRRTGRLRAALVVMEMALAIVLLTGAGLLIRSYGRIADVDPGVSSRGALTMRLSLPAVRYKDAPQISEGFDRILAAVEGVPGVSRVAAVSSLPLGGGGFYLGRVFLREGQAEPPETSDFGAQWTVVRSDYFAATGIPLLEGRAFTRDDTATSAPVVIVSREMARTMFPDGRALGKRIRSWRDENLYREIVGVTGDVRHFGLTTAVGSDVYVPHSQCTWRSLTLVVRSRLPADTLHRAVRAAIWSVDKKLPVADVRTLDEVVNRNMAEPRFSMFLLVIFGIIAVLLATVGIYGVIAYAVSQRTREIGVRMALGALRGAVIGMVTWNAFRLTAAGVLLGLATSLAAAHAFSSLLFEIAPTDPPTLAVSSVLLLGAATLAALVPAARAARIDPVSTLRQE